MSLAAKPRAPNYKEKYACRSKKVKKNITNKAIARHTNFISPKRRIPNREIIYVMMCIHK